MLYSRPEPQPQPQPPPQLPESIVLNIFSFHPSFIFYKHCKDVLLYDKNTTLSLLDQYYFRLNPNHNPSLTEAYLFLDYFLYHKHLLILDNHQQFEHYLRENYWVRDLCVKNPTNQTIRHSLRNIMRLSYFVNCLRELAKHQRQMTNDKIEQTNIGISFQCLIENINKETEAQTQMLKHYMTTSTTNSK